MANLSLGQRILSSESQINSRKIKLGANSLTDQDYKRMIHEIGLLSNADILLSEKTTISINEIKNDLTKLRRENPDREIVCFIDYLQLVKGNKIHQGNRTQEVGDISRVLKELSLSLDLSIVALAQLSRQVEQRQDKRPMLSDIRESGEIEQNADNIWFLYRDDYYDSQSENKGIVECIIAKQREGEVGTVNLAFVKEYGRFLNLERRFEQQ
jgi:replicative DNA helicase